MRRSEIFDTTKLSVKDQDRYGRTQIGQHMLIARNMLEAGVRFVKVTNYGWDTHGDNFNGTLRSCRNLIAPLPPSSRISR